MIPSHHPHLTVATFTLRSVFIQLVQLELHESSSFSSIHADMGFAMPALTTAATPKLAQAQDKVALGEWVAQMRRRLQREEHDWVQRKE